jgi:hypothetical protein
VLILKKESKDLSLSMPEVFRVLPCARKKIFPAWKTGINTLDKKYLRQFFTSQKGTHFWPRH